MTTYTLAFIDRDGRTITDVKGREISWTQAPPGLWLYRSTYVWTWYAASRVLFLTARDDGAEDVPAATPAPPTHETGLESDLAGSEGKSEEGSMSTDFPGQPRGRAAIRSLRSNL